MNLIERMYKFGDKWLFVPLVLLGLFVTHGLTYTLSKNFNAPTIREETRKDILDMGPLFPYNYVVIEENGEFNLYGQYYNCKTGEDIGNQVKISSLGKDKGDAEWVTMIMHHKLKYLNAEHSYFVPGRAISFIKR